MAPIIDLAAERAARLLKIEEPPFVDPPARGTFHAAGMLRLIPLARDLLALTMPQLATAKLPPGVGLRLADMSNGMCVMHIPSPGGPDAAA